MPILNDIIVTEISKYTAEYKKAGAVMETDSGAGVVIDKLLIRSKFSLDVAPFTHSRSRAALNSKICSLLLGNAGVRPNQAEADDTSSTSSLSPASGSAAQIASRQENLDSIFGQAMEEKFTVHNLSRSDDRRITLQVLFLYVLRHNIPLMYPTLESFLAAYPSLSDRPRAEQVKLYSNANWFDLALLTLKAQNNKSFLMSIVPRLSEGHNAKYITGSGESMQTRDRVQIFRKEGVCEPIKRAPRNRASFGYSTSQRASKRARINGVKDAAVLQSLFELSRKEGSMKSEPSTNNNLGDITYTPPMGGIGQGALDLLTDSALSGDKALSGIAHVDYFNGLTNRANARERNSAQESGSSDAFLADKMLGLQCAAVSTDSCRISQDTVASFTSRGRTGTKFGGIFKKMAKEQGPAKESHGPGK